MTPRQLLLATAALFRAADIPDPEVDGALLLSHLTGRAPLALRLDTDTILADDVLARFLALRAKRLRRVPLQYLTGEAEFLGQVFRVDERVLIPRPETEMLVERALATLAGRTAPRVLDLCCGSGCIGVSVKLARPDAQVTLTDASEGALAVAQENARRLGAQADFRLGDLFSPVEGAFDAILSNPPYIPAADCLTLQEEVRREPLMALDGGADGLDFYRRIAAQAPSHLTDGGVLLLEIGWDQGDTVPALLRQAGFADVRAHEDFQGILRTVEGVWHA
ncbi:MAG: peptide chain release factor N(5)-glutamine methyltransferase [Clostridia bacterium]|nr:peptide chain release factor N(5)-glutamine methyltransferase [Clostridia bacterium]